MTVQVLRLQVAEPREIDGHVFHRGTELRYHVISHLSRPGLYVDRPIKALTDDVVRLEGHIGEADRVYRCVSPGGAVMLLPKHDIRPYFEAAFDQIFGPPL